MRYKRLLVAVVLLAGCSKPKPVFHADPKPCVMWTPAAGQNYVRCDSAPPEALVYAELWKVCAEKKLKYSVDCYKELGCNAYAWDNKKKWGTSGDPYWIAHEDDPTAAAVQLLQVLRGAPNEHWVSRKSYVDDSTFRTGDVNPR